MKPSCPPVKHINETPANRHINYSLYNNNCITYRSSCWAWSSWNAWRSFDALEKEDKINSRIAESTLSLSTEWEGQIHKCLGVQGLS